MKFGVVARRDKTEALKLAYKIYDFLKINGIDVVVEKDTFKELPRFNEGDVLPLEEFDVDVIVVIGGDGTILRVEHKTRREIPILGINMGTLGFLTEVEPTQAFFAISKVINGNYIIDERMKLRTYIDGLNSIPDALNEVAVLTGNPGKILHLKYYVDKSPAEDIRGDGLIVSTPTGSTGYAMSAGGPFVDPRLEVIVLAPLAPIALNARPMVIPATSEVHIKNLSITREMIIAIDGQYQNKLNPESVIEIEKSPRKTKFIRFSREIYPKYTMKLKWRF